MRDEFILQKKTDIGLIREKNEDSSLVLTHPRDKKIKLLAIADGMGGKDLGDVAASYVTSNLEDWFKKSKISLLNDNDKVIKELDDLVYKLNDDLIKEYGENKLGTTLSLALINKNNTLSCII